MVGVRVLLLHPEIAARSCRDCQAYQFHDKGPGQFAEKPMTRGGQNLPRAIGKPPCHWCPKILAGDEPNPGNAVELSERNWRAYQHYLECRAVDDWPDDPIVRRNASLIRSVEDTRQRIDQGRLGLAILSGVKR